MLQTYPSTSCPAVARLFASLEYHLSIRAVLAGSMPGTLVCDHPEHPTTALIYSPEGTYLAAETPGPELAHAYARLLAEAPWRRSPDIYLFCESERWQPFLDRLFVPGSLEHYPRRFYQFDAGTPLQALTIPPGMTLERIDAAMLANTGLVNHTHMHGWAVGNWGSAAGFLAHGFGHVLVAGNMIVSWSLADSMVDEQAEIGIHTDPRYQRHGYAGIVVAANLQHALAHGIQQVGWHCAEQNYGSQRVAEKAGFTQRRTMICHYGRVQDDQR